MSMTRDPAPRSTPPDARPRVLVIDDTPEVGRTVRRALSRSGMDVELASSGEEGLRMVRAAPPSVVLTDVNMPGMSGFDVLEALRSDPATAMIPVVLVTARDDRASVRRGMSMGADDYLTKPFTLEELRETVQARLDVRSRIDAVMRRRLEQTRAALWEARHCDPETGLPNRAAFRARLEVVEEGPSPLAVLALDLDRFERLDLARPGLVEVMAREVALRLRRASEGGDVYRTGPSSFAVLHPAVGDAPGAEALADRLLAELRQPIAEGDIELRLTASVGVALWERGGGASAAEVASRAASAAASARESGGNHAQLFDPKAHGAAHDRLLLESSLHRALERRQFELHYQPQVATDTGALLGVEALIRWRHPELGLISPFHFIPIAEETGLIVEIGRWVLEEACAQAASWSDELPELAMSVNLSALQLGQSDLVATVRRVLEETGLAAARLKLELTETMMVQAGPRAAESLRALSAMGVGISIDDFGTGYSSLGNLRSFPVGELKIDRSFVRHVPEDRDSCSIVSAVIEMAHQLGLRVVAEGAEELAQIEFLRQQRCDEIQGYYYSKPLPPEALLAWARGYREVAA